MLASAILALRQTTDTRYPGASRIGHQRSQAGVIVTPDSALRNSVVWACRSYLSETVAQCPPRVMVTNRDGTAIEAKGHPADTVLASRPNPEISPFQFIETLVGWACLWGNGYAEIERDQVGRVIALWPLEPWRVTPMRRDDGALFYRVHNSTAAPDDLEPMSVFHLRGWGHGPVGLNVVEYASESIGWAQATELFGASFFGEGLNPAGFIEGAGKLDDAGRKRLKAELDSMYKGPRKSNRWVLLDGLMKWTKMSTQPNDAQFIETLQFQVEVICRIFRVPPQKVMHLLRSTNNNIEHQAIEVIGDTISPWAKRFEQEATYKLFGQNRGGYFVKLDLKGLLRGDFATRQAGLKVQRDEGIISANEWRHLEDMGPIGPDGDKRIVAVNMTTLEKIGTDSAPAAQTQAAVADIRRAAADLEIRLAA